MKHQRRSKERLILSARPNHVTIAGLIDTTRVPFHPVIYVYVYV